MLLDILLSIYSLSWTVKDVISLLNQQVSLTFVYPVFAICFHLNHSITGKGYGVINGLIINIFKIKCDSLTCGCLVKKNTTWWSNGQDLDNSITWTWV
uniref:Uncharacterized protein n=1 Tax=Tetranychus urticae TaxID=32264 RepID=T1KDV6_TETUR